MKDKRELILMAFYVAIAGLELIGGIKVSNLGLLAFIYMGFLMMEYK